MSHSHLLLDLIYCASFSWESSAQALHGSCCKKPNIVVNPVHFEEFLLVFPLQNISWQSGNSNKTKMLCSSSFKKLLIIQMPQFREWSVKFVASSPLYSYSVTQAAIPTHSFQRRVKMSSAGKMVLFAFWLISIIPGGSCAQRGEQQSSAPR